MTAPTPEVPAEAPQVAPAAPPEASAAPEPEKDWKAEAEKWKAFSRQHEDRARANAEAAKRLKEIEDRDLSELQKAQRDIEEYRQRAETAERAALRNQVALAKGIPADLVDTLAGATAEELTAHADRLLAWRGSVAPAPVPQPKPDPGQGAQPLSGQAAEDAEYAKYKAELFPSYQQT